MKSDFSKIIKENPVFVYLLGIVPVLGSTVYGITSVVMGLATFFVLIASNLLVSYIKEYINPKTEIFIYIISTALFTTIVDLIIKYISLDLYNSLGIYLPLIIVNCLILNNLFVFASQDNVKDTLYNSLKTGAYFIFAITIVGVLREFLGSGSIFGFEVIPNNIPRILLSQTPAGGFFILAGLCIVANQLMKEKA